MVRADAFRKAGGNDSVLANQHDDMRDSHARGHRRARREVNEAKIGNARIEYSERPIERTLFNLS